MTKLFIMFFSHSLVVDVELYSFFLEIDYTSFYILVLMDAPLVLKFSLNFLHIRQFELSHHL
jgi:hypothetical protein